MVKKDSKYFKWISATLQNDENSSDKEMINYLMKEGKKPRKEAEFYVEQREKALNDIDYNLEKYDKHHKVKKENKREENGD